MIKFKYSDLSDGSSMAYKTFDRHYKSFEARRKQLERMAEFEAYKKSKKGG